MHMLRVESFRLRIAGGIPRRSLGPGDDMNTKGREGLRHCARRATPPESLRLNPLLRLQRLQCVSEHGDNLEFVDLARNHNDSIGLLAPADTTPQWCICRPCVRKPT